MIFIFHEMIHVSKYDCLITNKLVEYCYMLADLFEYVCFIFMSSSEAGM